MPRAKTEFEDLKLYGGDVTIRFYPNSHRYFRLKYNRNIVTGHINEFPDLIPLNSVTSVTNIIDKSGALLPWAERLTNEYVIGKFQGLPGNLKALNTNWHELVDIVKDAAHQYAVVKKEAASIGDIVHDYCKQFAIAKIEGKPLPKIDDMPQQALNGINAFLNWVKKHNVEFLSAETIVYSKKYGYVGRRDAYARVDGIRKTIDYKTSKDIYPEMKMQAAAYEFAANEERMNTDRSSKIYAFAEAEILHFNKDTGDFKTYSVNVRKAFPGFTTALMLKKLVKELK